MNKQIAIVTDKASQLFGFLEKNIRLVLGEHVEINHYFIDEIKKTEKIKDKLILVMTPDRMNKISNYISKDSKIIVIRRTFQEKEIYKLFSISRDTHVLVVNDTDETTLDTMSIFYKIGITNLKLTPCLEEGNYEDINIAITPGVKYKVPRHIEKIIDLGNRYIDISTFIEIINGLDIDSKEVRTNLIKYSESIISLDNGVKDKYKELFLKVEELDTILNLSKDGMIFCSQDNKINSFNNKILEILELNKGIGKREINEIFTGELEVLLEDREIVDEVILYNKKYLNINKKYIYNTHDKKGTYFSFQEITYIKKLEQNLTKKLKDKGHTAKYNFNDINTKNCKMLNCIELGKKVSKSDLSVLIIGESGTGKEVMAQSIHNNSNRSSQPFIAVNCAAVPENLLESQLFGYEKGAFTGALKEGKKGLFELANNGTIFLDEIGDMPPLLQTKLLRVLQEKQVMPVGSYNVIDIDVRIIAATNKNLELMIQKGEFREDLYYRLNVLPIDMPSLKERKEDIIHILNGLLKRNLKVESETKELLINYEWKGNIRQLQNVASYINLMCDSIVLKSDLPPYIKSCKSNENIDELKFDRDKIIGVLKVLIDKKSTTSGVGRGTIIDILKEDKIDISEIEVRKILAYLNENKYIKSKSGRCGSSITTCGEEFYEKITS